MKSINLQHLRGLPNIKKFFSNQPDPLFDKVTFLSFIIFYFYFWTSRNPFSTYYKCRVIRSQTKKMFRQFYFFAEQVDLEEGIKHDLKKITYSHLKQIYKERVRRLLILGKMAFILPIVFTFTIGFSAYYFSKLFNITVLKASPFRGLYGLEIFLIVCVVIQLLFMFLYLFNPNRTFFFIIATYMCLLLAISFTAFKLFIELGISVQVINLSLYNYIISSWFFFCLFLCFLIMFLSTEYVQVTFIKRITYQYPDSYTIERLLGLLSIIYKNENWHNIEMKQTMIEYLSSIARALNNLDHFVEGDPETRAWFRKSLLGKSYALKSYKKWILTPKPDTRDLLTKKLTMELVFFLNGQWDCLDEKDIPPKKYSTYIGYFIFGLRTYILPLLLPVAFFLFQLTPYAIKDSIANPISTFLLFWSVVSIVSSMGSSNDSKTDLFKSLLSIFLPTKGP